jgi:hypothetical protein
MTPKQYKAAIERLGLSQERAGVFFGYSTRQGQRWALGEAPIPTAVDYAIRLMIEFDRKPVDLNKDFA